jgi:hypothetical protein
MSLVALLAGKQHSDRPSTACPVITAFVIRINDAIDKPARHDDTTIEFTVNPVPGKASTILEKEGPFSVRNAAAKRTGIAISAWIPGRTRNDDAAVEQITFKLPIGLPVQKPADRSQTMCGAVCTFPRPGDALTGFEVRVVDSASAELVDDEHIGSYGTGCQNYRRDRESELNCHVTILTCHQWPRQSDPGSAVSREGGTSSIRR